jgi:hypothetical protein
MTPRGWSLLAALPDFGKLGAFCFRVGWRAIVEAPFARRKTYFVVSAQQAPSPQRIPPHLHGKTGGEQFRDVDRLETKVFAPASSVMATEVAPARVCHQDPGEMPNMTGCSFAARGER